VRREAPAEPGEHTREVLLELGYTVEEMQALARKAVVRGAGLPGKAVADKS
jgi:crotonobetainyl-CoA:carnitine CoA-transferase CaiB-like acyl-CoA transferase